MTDGIETIDHLIDVISTANIAQGEPVRLFIREKRLASQAGGSLPVVLFIHGGTYPGVADFDLPVEDYSWMAFLAARGFHVFTMDCPGYGYSSRNWMGDPTLAGADAAGTGCKLRSPQSDWQDIDEVVEFIRERTGAASINLIGWSAGGPRAGGYAAIHPNNVDRLILLAPAYIRGGRDTALDTPAEPGPPLRLTTRQSFDAMWDNEVKRPDQVDAAVREKIWSLLMEIDPVGASWQPPVVRSPNTSMAAINRGWNQAMAARIVAPSLLITMEWDVHIRPGIVEELFEDLTVEDKVYATISGASHYMPWERDHALLHHLSATWFSDGVAGGLSRGRLSIDPRI